MTRHHDKRFPGESDEYRNARDELLQTEIDLRRRVEAVAAQRRRLPPGGMLKEDYIFEEGAAGLSDRELVNQVRFSDLFEDGKASLVAYSFMYAPDAEMPCTMCTAILDSFNGNAPHITQRVNFAVIAKAPIQTVRNWARERNWTNLCLLSSGGNTYNADYFAESTKGDQMPALNVFQKTADGIRHVYGAELLYVASDEGQNPRHADLMWPLWNVFDLTPEGRETGWYPKPSYG